MRFARVWFAAVGLLGMLAGPDRAGAQAVGFFPGVGSAPDGLGLSATPIVSADRRYVRLSLGVGFQTVDGFRNFPVPAAVSGGGPGGGGIGVVTGMNGPIGMGMPGGPGGLAAPMGLVGSGFSDPGFSDGFVEDLGVWQPSPRRTKVTRPKSVRPRKVAAGPAKRKP